MSGRPGALAPIASSCVLTAVVAFGGCQRREPAPAAAPAASVAPAVLAEGETDLPHVSVRLLELVRVSEGTIELRFSLSAAPDAPGPVGIAEVLGDQAADRGRVADVYVVDAASQKKYFVLRDVNHQAVSSRNLGPLEPGETRVLWTRLGAPPPEVVEVDVKIPHTPPFAGVPIATPDRSPEASQPVSLVVPRGAPQAARPARPSPDRTAERAEPGGSGGRL